MLKKSLLIGVLCIGLIAMLETQAKGWGWNLGDILNMIYKCYTGQWPMRGGGPEKDIVSVDGTYTAKIAYADYYNPGGDRSVRVGVAASCPVNVTPIAADVRIDENGIFWIDHHMPSSSYECVSEDSVTEEPIFPDCHKYIEEGGGCDDESLDTWQQAGCALEKYWGVSILPEDQKKVKDNWSLGEILVIQFEVSAKVQEYDAAGDTVGEPKTEIEANCLTDEGWRDWPGDDGEVFYVCRYPGEPFAFNDSFFGRKNKVLVVEAPGVIINDVDLDGPELDLVVAEVNEATVKSGMTVSTDKGQVTMSPYGGFTYTPEDGFTKGVDSFSYIIKDKFNNESNLAWVTITIR